MKTLGGCKTQTFIVFTGTSNENGESWCSDCVEGMWNARRLCDPYTAAAVIEIVFSVDRSKTEIPTVEMRMFRFNILDVWIDNNHLSLHL